MTPTVGFVLLVGLVAVGATVTVIAGWYVIDSLEAETEAELTYAAAESTSHEITTTARTGQSTSATLEGATVTETGTVTVKWTDASGDIHPDSHVDEEPLGAIEYGAGDRTVVYQGGGIWEQRDGTYRTHSAPAITDDGSTLEVRLVSLDGSDYGTGERTIRAVEDTDDRLDDRPDAYDNLSVIIESEHRDAWYQYLEATVPASEHEAFTVEREGDDTVTVTVTNVSETRSAASVTVDAVRLLE
ncbi:hypothetical protein D8Y22_12690 [Salinadaptatus halalkaliphilus]|uniref:Flagellin n=1 Tax=Salinadaptatus halalkaliphilus TaxID=2419781 RepID=A0A4S3TN31_9EURY|nr:hypothetical protein [Salinadaptatus halalkaliphilus]THE64495.1 hypothetical protein D8Y22_12690 [Salinadaptatus halalkaliphilus]